jgi:ABC-type arginine/histidine transport system permease subunit
MGITQQIIAENYQNMLYLSLAGLIYFAMNFIIIRAFRCFENMTTIKNIVKI